MHHSLIAIILPFIGQVDLSGYLLVVFFLCVLAVIGFEFVNGFHDTANAVATVIYTKALKPVYAIPWSGCWNFLGVMLGGVTVAMGILKLVPLDTLMTLPVSVGACLVLAVLLSSIIWNLGTWYLGIPCSSSHTMIGAMIGGGLAFTWYYNGPGVNWHKAEEIGSSLILSPIIGFGAAALLMLFLKHVTKSHALFHIPSGEHDRPPIHIRLLLITTCTLVSFFHGSNDGQKGVGLFMLILIAFMPARFAVNHAFSNDKVLAALNQTELVVSTRLSHNADKKPVLTELAAAINQTKASLAAKNEKEVAKTYHYRKQVEGVVKDIRALLNDNRVPLNGHEKTVLISAANELEHVTDFAPVWVIAIISLSLGLGTMIGWKRIVVTIGEKIGNEHLNYAQGATSEIVAASTIGLSTAFGLPVSTTHVLSSGIAGAMVASGGKGNLNNKTLKNIALAWVLTLPVAIILAMLLFHVLSFVYIVIIMKQILVATDFSPSAANAMEYAMGLAALLNLEVCAIHAIHPTEGINNSTYNAIFIEDYYRNKREALKDWAAVYTSKPQFKNVKVITLCDVGFLKTVIRKHIAAHQVELLAMGITGATGLSGIVGSNASMMVTKIKIPTLIVPLESRFPVSPTITLATDYETKLSPKDVTALNKMVKAFDAKQMQVLYVDERSDAAHIQTGEARLKTLIKHTGLVFNYLKDTSPLSGIMGFIEKNQTDILCLVKHHHNIIYRLFNRSTVNQIMNRTVKAILVLHE